MKVYYNEIEPFAVQWLKNLMVAGYIPEGEVDTRPIQEVQPDDVRGYDQCHFFAGLGGWAYALRLADWRDRPVWTGSCPCQPFSSAGRKVGGDDPRHLWPVWFRLIAECQPPTVFGEQVEAAVRHGWLDLVQGDLEAEGYTVGAAVLGAHSVGAPHIRQRLWFVAESQSQHEGRGLAGPCWRSESSDRRRLGVVLDDTAGTRHESARPWESVQSEGGQWLPGERGASGVGLADTRCHERGGREAVGGTDSAAGDQASASGGERFRLRPGADVGDGGPDGALAVPVGAGRPEGRSEPWLGPPPRGDGDVRALADAECGAAGRLGLELGGAPCCSGATAREQRLRVDPWSGCDWLPCRDGKARPVEPGTFPLAHGVPGRVGRLRAYGNAVVPQVAEAFIRAYLTCR